MITIAEPLVDWIRAASLLAAECTVCAPATAALDPRHGWPEADDRWAPMALAAPEGALDDWLVAAVAASERHPEVAAAFSILAEDERILLPTPAGFARIAVAGLGADYDDALAVALGRGPGGLLQSGTLERVEPVGTSRPLAQQGLRLSARSIHLVFGAEAPTPIVEVEPPPEVVVHQRSARAAASLLAEDGVLWVRGLSRRLGRQFALDIAGQSGQGVYFLRPREGGPDPVLGGPVGAMPVIDLFDLDVAPPMPGPGRNSFVVIAPVRMEHPGFRAVDAPSLDDADATVVWQTVDLSDDDRTELAARFQLTLPEVRAAVAEAGVLRLLALPDLDVTPDSAPRGSTGASTGAPARTLTRAIRADGARRMGPSVTLVESDVTLDDLVASPQTRSQLEDAVDWYRHGRRVWSEMGLDRDAADARGLSLMFSGPPGGGKTFAARCLANALDLNLYRIDLSQVVSKYIGETEKALARVFDEAEAGHGVLFFDEADAIFGKRSEVKDAHDRYANIEVGYLLQRMETFGGVMILASNLRANVDPAFLRRIRFLVEFAMPGPDERRTLWDRNLPTGGWRDPDLDLDLLTERFRLSGGNIRNVAVAASHLAAAQGAPVGPGHLARALYRELEKSGLPRGQTEFGPLAEHLQVVP